MGGWLGGDAVLGRALAVRARVSWWAPVWAAGFVTVAAVAGGWLPTGRAVAIGVATVMVVAFSMVVHELGHVVAAVISAVPVDRVDFVGPGAETVLARAPARAKQAAVVAIGGPSATGLLVLLGLTWCACAGAGEGGLRELFLAGSMWQVLSVLLVAVNIELLVVNLLPGLPRDGGRLIWAVLWGRSGTAAESIIVPARLGVALGVGLFVGAAVVAHGGDLVGAGLLSALGLLQMAGALPCWRLAREVQALRAATVDQAIAPVRVFLRADDSVDDALAVFDRGGMRTRQLPVVDHAESFIGLAHREDVVAARGTAIRLDQVVTPPQDELNVELVDASQGLAEHLVRGALTRNGALVVVESDGRYRGIVYRTSVPLAIARAQGVLEPRSP